MKDCICGWITTSAAHLCPLFVVCSVILLYKWDTLSPRWASARQCVSWGSMSGWLLCVVSATRSCADSSCLVHPITMRHYDSGQPHLCVCVCVGVYMTTFVSFSLPLPVCEIKTGGWCVFVVMAVSWPDGRLGDGKDLLSINLDRGNGLVTGRSFILMLDCQWEMSRNANEWHSLLTNYRQNAFNKV